MVASQTAMRVGRAFDDPERALGELARARGPLRRIVAALAARFVARQGWAPLGFARLGDYARERLGVSARSLQDWARVGEKLGGLPALSGGLPALEAALVSGRLSWSKVRMIARFVDADEEREWIAYAANVCVRQLERELRAVDRGALESGTVAHARTTDDGSDGESEPAVWLRLSVPRRMAFQWRHVCRYAAKVDGQDLSDGDVLERVTAETLSALPVVLERGDPDDGEEVEERSAEAAGREEVEVGAGPLVAPSDGSAEIPAFLCPLLEDVDVADPFELDARLRRAIRLEQRLDAELAPLIRQVTSAGYDWERGYRSLAALASELGMSPSKARALVRVERLGGVCPALRDGFRDGTLSYAQVQTLAPLLAGRPEGPSGTDWRAAWVRFAKTVTVRALKETVARARLARDTDGAFEEHRADPDFFAPARWDDGDRPETGEQTCARTARPGEEIGPYDSARLGIVVAADVARLFRATLCTVRRAVESDTGRLPDEGEAFEAMVDHALESWGVDERQLRRQLGRVRFGVFERDGWRCTVPGCTARRNLHVHHIRFRSQGGGDEPWNLTTMCACHHLRGVHEGTVTVGGCAPDRLVFELGVRAGHEPLARYRSGDRVV